MAARARVEAGVLRGGAAVLVALLALRALLHVDDSWDTWAYHLPFAARLWNIVPRSSFEMDDHLELLFRAYPVAVEWLEGALWLLTGRVQAASFVALGSLLAFVELLRWRFGVSRWLSVLSLLAIPLVQIHATACYVDLPANLAAAASVLLACRAWTAERAEPLDVSLGTLCAAFAAGSKYQMAPIAALLALGFTLLLVKRPEARTRTAIALHVLGILAGAYPYLRNGLVFGSPFFPIATESLYRGGPGSLTNYSGPDYLAKMPGPARWVASVLGVGELDPLRGMFSIDQATAREGSRSWLMGGYFGPFVICQLVFLWRLGRTGSRTAKGALVTVLAVSLLTSVSPQAHQLRYYLYWVLVLVGANLILLHTLPERAPFGVRAYAWLSVACLLAVTALTRGRFFDPSLVDRPVARMLEERVPAAVLAKLRPGGRYCLVGEPFPPLLLSAESLGRAPYALESSKHVEHCQGGTPVWMTADGRPPR